MRNHRLPTIIGAAALTLVTLAGCGDDPEPTASDPEPTETSSSATPTEETSEPAPTDSATPSESPSNAPDQVTVPVYFVGDTPQGPRLFREFRRVEADNPLEEAATLLTAGDVLDPDYRTLFPGGAFSGVTYDEGAGLLIATVPDDGWNTPAEGMSRREARLAVQALVYTLQGVVQERAALRVVSQRGSAVPLFGVPTDDGVTNAPPLKVLALVNVITPEQGATVSGSFTASGVASSFEATVPWEIRQDGEVVERGFSTAEGWMDKLYPWQTEVDVSGLAPGDYEFVAMTDDPSGGEGPGPTEDSKTITVD